MRKSIIILCGFLVLTWSLLVAGNALALTLNFSNLRGSVVTFWGSDDTFQFQHRAGSNDFKITTGSDYLDAGTVGLQGNISGSFAIEPIVTSGGVQTAQVASSNGHLEIFDRAGYEFMAPFKWLQITTQAGGGAINGTISFSGWQYGGSNPDLLVLTRENGSAVLTFHFVPAKSLSDLTSISSASTSFAGNFTAAPLPSTILLGCTSLIPFFFMRRRSRKE